MKNDHIKQLIDAHKRVVKVLEQIPSDKKINENWTKREVITHLAGWYKEAIDAIPKILKGEKPISFKMSVDKFNERSLENRKDKNLAEVTEEMIYLHKKLIEQIESLSENQIIECYGTYLRKEPINVLWIINETIHHNNEHAEELEKLAF